MAVVSAIIFLILGVLALVLYGGTPHGTGTTICGPIDFFGHTFTLNTDCQYISLGELIIAGAFFALAMFTALAARPRSEPPRPHS